MQPADASPATETSAADRGGRTAGSRAGGSVPPPRSAPGSEATPVPPPRTAPEAETAPRVQEARDATGAAAETVPRASSGVVGDPTEAPPIDDTAPDGAASDGDAAPGTAGVLTERERAILDFEQRWWRHAGAKEQAIRDTFGLSATRYYQLLNALLDHPAALAAAPVLVGRLRRLRSSRARNRRR
ncbi:DUF3263 domain-containing protein [Micromonospora sp. LZ34]